jgi:hypothetical protein
VGVIKEENKKFKNQRSKIKMTNQNAKILSFALSLQGTVSFCHFEEHSSFVIARLAKPAEASSVEGRRLPRFARNDRTGKCGENEKGNTE